MIIEKIKPADRGATSSFSQRRYSEGSCLFMLAKIIYHLYAYYYIYMLAKVINYFALSPISCF